MSCHKGVEMGPKDDCESWFYLLIDLILVGGLPWKKLYDKSDVLKAKEEARHGSRTGLFGNLKHTDELNKIIDYIDTKAYQDRMDYQYIYKTLELACSNLGFNIDAPYDWEVAKKESDIEKGKEKEQREPQPSSKKELQQPSSKKEPQQI